MGQWPGTVPVFLSYEMRCVGCVFGPFHSVADACKEHHVGQTEFLRSLNEAAELQAPPSRTSR